VASKQPARFWKELLPLLVVFAFMIIVTALHRSSLLGLDFRAYYTAGKMMLAGVSRDFYDLTTQLEAQRWFVPELADSSRVMLFLNPPFLAIPLAAVSLWRLEIAYGLWAVLNIIIFAIVYRRLLDAVSPLENRSRRLTRLAILSFCPVWATLVHGQVSFLILLSLLGAWAALRSGRDFHGGLWLGLALVRPQLLLVVVLMLVWRRRWAAVAGFAVAAGAALLTSLALVGGEGLAQYTRLLAMVAQGGDQYTVHPQLMVTWRGFCCQLLQTNDPVQVWPWWLTGLLLTVVALLVAWRGPWTPTTPRFDLQWALLIVAAIFSSPHLNAHDYSLLLLAGVLISRFLAHTPVTRTISGWLVALLILGLLTMTFIPLGCQAIFANSELTQRVLLLGSVPVLLVALLAIPWILVRSNPVASPAPADPLNQPQVDFKRA